MRVVILLFAISFLSYSPGKIKLLYASIHPSELASLLSFYTLFPESEEGKMAKQRAENILGIHHIEPKISYGILSMIHKQIPIDKKMIENLTDLGKDLPNRKLLGSYAQGLKEVSAIPLAQFDLAQGLLALGKEDPKVYGSILDIMAKTIMAKLKEKPSDMEKMAALSEFIFYDLEIRFPAQSFWKQNIKQFTFLPSVIDEREGVCLGVCVLYLTLAQRLDLPLEIITPPGHIYVRLPTEMGHFNIETTARGVHLPDDRYVNISMNYLQTRNIKETLGLVLINEASEYLHQKRYERAINTYEKALIFLPKDAFLYELLGISRYLNGEKKKADFALKVSTYLPQEHNVCQDTMAIDVLQQKTSKEAMESILEQDEEYIDAIYQRKLKLESVVSSHPEFLTGLFHLAICNLQLGMIKQATRNLGQYIRLQPNDPSALYYLTICFLQRGHFESAWTYLKKCQELKPDSKELWAIERYIKQVCPIYEENVSTEKVDSF